jgi:hypothetical protein
MKNMIIERVVHDGVNRVSLRFDYDKELISVARGIPGAKWSSRMKCYYIQYART